MPNAIKRLLLVEIYRALFGCAELIGLVLRKQAFVWHLHAIAKTRFPILKEH